MADCFLHCKHQSHFLQKIERKSSCHQCKTHGNGKRSARPAASVAITVQRAVFHPVYMPNLPCPSNWNFEPEPTVNKHVLTASTYRHTKRALVIRSTQLLQHAVMCLWQPPESSAQLHSTIHSYLLSFSPTAQMLTHSRAVCLHLPCPRTNSHALFQNYGGRILRHDGHAPDVTAVPNLNSNLNYAASLDI